MSEQEVSMEKLATYEKTWLDNAFWETPQKQLLNAIVKFVKSCNYLDLMKRALKIQYSINV
jgi:hypothetical protein